MLDNVGCDDQVSVFSRSNMGLMVHHAPPSVKDPKAPGLQLHHHHQQQQQQQQQQDAGKYVRYTAEQVQALERLYNECPKPSSLRRQQLIRECPILQNIEPKQIKVWFQNRRCREKQRKESSRLQTVNSKLTAMNKLLMEENDRLQKQVSHLLYENGYLRQQLQHGGITTETSSDSVVTSGLQHLPTPTQSPQDASYSGIRSLAEEALGEFLGKATGTAIDWIQMPGMKPGPDSVMVHISRGCAGVAARACGLVNLEPARIVEVLKDRPSWHRECRRSTAMFATPSGNGGSIEVLYTQMYAPTTLAPARDFYTMRLSCLADGGGYVICERSINAAHGAPMAPQMQSFIRAEMHASGCLIKPCEGGGSIVILVDHMDLEPWTVPEVLRPLYESSAVLAHKVTLAAFRHLRHLAQEGMTEAPGQQPAAVRSLSHRLAKGFDDAVNGFVDDGWAALESEGTMDDITILVKEPGSTCNGIGRTLHTSCGVLCAKASMLLQNVPPALLVRFLHEHRSEWADSDCEEAMRLANPDFAGFHGSACNSQVLQPQIHAVEKDEFLELIKMEGRGLAEPGDSPLLGTRPDMFLLQLCSGMEESGAGACAQMVFAPIDASISDDVAMVPSGFRVIPLDNASVELSGGSPTTRTLDLASTLEVQQGGRSTSSHDLNQQRSVLTIAFQFTYDVASAARARPTSSLTVSSGYVLQPHLEAVASMARQYVRNVVSTVQRVAMALAPPRCLTSSPSTAHHQHSLLNPGQPAAHHHLSLRSAAPALQYNSIMIPEALLLARWICRSYNLNLGLDLVRVESDSSEDYLKALWKLEDAVVCCSVKSLPAFTFANQAGLDMLETTSMALQELSWEKTLDADGRKSLSSVVAQVMQQGYACLEGGTRLSGLGRPVSYDRAVAWKVVEDDDSVHGVAFLYVNWSFGIPASSNKAISDVEDQPPSPSPPPPLQNHAAHDLDNTLLL